MGEGGCELATAEVGRDLCLPSGFCWEWAVRVQGAAGRAGALEEADGLGSEAAGLYFLPFFPPPLCWALGGEGKTKS